MTKLSKSVKACVLAAAFLGAVAAQAQMDATARIVVQESSYAFDGKSIAGLDTLEASVREVHPKTIELSACGSDATHNLKAAVHRFSDFPLEIQVVSAASSRCSAGFLVRPVNLSTGNVARGADDAAIDQYWQQVAP